MKFLSKMKETMSVGLDGSKKFLDKARNKMQDVGESSVLRLEIHQLENQLRQEYTTLGTQVYGILSEGEKNSISLKTPELKDSYSELERILKMIEEKKKLLKMQEEIDGTVDSEEVLDKSDSE